jgi:hypothetical protein
MNLYYPVGKFLHYDYVWETPLYLFELLLYSENVCRVTKSSSLTCRIVETSLRRIRKSAKFLYEKEPQNSILRLRELRAGCQVAL